MLKGKEHIVLKSVLVTIGLAGIVAVTAKGCPGPNDKPTDPCRPNGCAVSGTLTEVGDGSWIVGDELAQGTWKSEEKLSDDNKPNCGWYITPTPKVAAAANKDGTVTIVLKRPVAKSFTTLGCGKWHKVG